MARQAWRAAVLAGAFVFALAACGGDRHDHAAQAGPGSGPAASRVEVGQPQVVEVAVTEDGFVPASFRVKAGQPVRLVVTRKVERTCATEIVIKDLSIAKALPLGQPVEVAFTAPAPGKLRFACAMDMIGGEIQVD